MEIKCDKCTAPMVYDLTRRMLVCQYCGFEKIPEHVPEMKSYETGSQRAISNEKKKTAEENVRPRNFTEQASCQSCGAVFVGRDNLISQTCPYCGSVLVSVDKNADLLPDGVIPFMVDANGVEGALRFPIFNNTLVPVDFKNENKAEDLHEFFMSMWIFDLDTSAEFSGHYNDGKKFHKDKKSRGHFEKFYDNVVICGTKKHGMDQLDVTPAFRFTNYQPCDPEYLAGHPAELPDVSREQALEEAKTKIYALMQEDIEGRMSTHYHAEEVQVENLQINYTCESARLILVPMWGKENVYRGKSYPTLVSGQTGQYCGDYPSSLANMGAGVVDLFKRNKKKN